MYGRRRNYGYGTYNKKKYASRGKKPLAGYGRSIGQYGRFQINKTIPDTVTKELKFHHRNGIDKVRGCNNSFNGGWVLPTGASTPDAEDEKTLVNIKMGNAGYQREGRKIVVKSLRFKGVIASPINNLAQDNIDASNTNAPKDNAGYSIRFIIFKDKQCNGLGVSNLGDLLDKDTFTHSISAAPTALEVANLNRGLVFGGRNLYNSERFEFLCDDLYTTGAIYSNIANEWVWTPIKIDKEFKLNTPVLYNEQDEKGVFANIKSNNFQFAIIGNWGEGNNACMILHWSHEIRYYDD